MDFKKKMPKTKQVAVRMTQAMYDEMCMYSEEMGANTSTFIEFAIQRLLNDLQKESEQKGATGHE